MAALEQEELRVVLLDTKRRIMRTATVYRGSVNQAQVRVAEVFRDAVRQQATALVAVHNHPSGDPTPSAADVALTVEIVAAGQLLDIELLDHLIIGQGRWLSLKRLGLGLPEGVGVRRSDQSERNRKRPKNERLRATIQYPSSTAQMNGRRPARRTACRVPCDFLQDEEDRPASGELPPVGGHDLHRAAGLLAQRRGHGWARTLLIGNNHEPLRAVMPPDPGGSSPSEVSPTVPDQPVLSRRECTLHRLSSVPPIGFTVLRDWGEGCAASLAAGASPRHDGETGCGKRSLA